MTKEELDNRAKATAITEWCQFKSVIGDYAMRSIYAKILNENGYSYQEIAIKLHITKRQAQIACTHK